MNKTDRDQDTPLAVTVIGGYLGAGKTTLVNHLLRQADGLRLAVLVNEFGALPIDADLIEAEDENIISIAGGCVCCSYGNDLIMALIDLAGMTPKPDHVLLEASGVALPGAIAASISLLDQYVLDGVIVLADAETVRNRAHDTYMGDTITRQLSDADIVLLNKVDLVSLNKLTETHRWLSQQSKTVRIIDAIQSVVPIEVALGVQTSMTHDMPISGHHEAGHFGAATFVPSGPVNVADLARRLASEELNLVRAKGFVKSIDGQTHAIQVVGRRWTSSVASVGASIGIVCIGLKSAVDHDQIECAILQARSNA